MRINKRVIGLIAALVVVEIILHAFTDVLRNAFYLRVPIVSGALLFSLPVVCVYLFPTFLGNVFVLSNKWRLAVVLAATAMTALAIILITGIIASNTDARFGVAECAFFAWLIGDGFIFASVFAILLALPTAIAAYVLSNEMKEPDRRVGALLGAIGALLLLAAVHWLRSFPVAEWAQETLILLLSLLPEEARAGFVADGALAPGHLAAAAFLMVAGGVYAVGHFLYRPSVPAPRWQAPTLFYILILILILSFVLGLLTFIFDFYRLPIVLVVVLFTFAVYRVYNVEHYYRLRPAARQPVNASDFTIALERRLAHQGDARTLVVVCASGGGIQAAGWATAVLTGLQKLLGEDFTRAIGMISSVSGGSVGTLFFLDRFGANGAADTGALDEIFDASTKDSLDATGWGFTYPDLWRVLGLPFLKTTPPDRGAAVETDWKSAMKDPHATLRAWVAPILEGKLPIPVFNATVVEDGRPYLLCPMSFEFEPKRALDFNGLYPDHDVDASTAALLSAAFPYVTPVMRNSDDPACPNLPVFHIADGGFFDNFGVVTVVDWLDRHVLPYQAQLKLKRVLFLELRASADQPYARSAPNKRAGWLMAILGPLFALVHARSATQGERNDDDVSWLIDKWNAELRIEQFRISFPAKVAFYDLPIPDTGVRPVDTMMGRLKERFARDRKYQPPLSWALTGKQKEAIRIAWRQLAAEEGGVIEKIKTAWGA